MKQINGFGKWKILDKEGGIYCEEYGIINMEDKLFIETDSKRATKGKVLNLIHFKGWELLEEDEANPQNRPVRS